MRLDYIAVLMVAGGALFFYRAARMARASPWLLMGLSLLIGVAGFFQGFSYAGLLAGQAALFVAWWLWRVVRDGRRK